MPRYAWGAGVPVAVAWQLPDEGAWAETGRVEVPGTATDVFGQAIARDRARRRRRAHRDRSGLDHRGRGRLARRRAGRRAHRGSGARRRLGERVRRAGDLGLVGHHGCRVRRGRRRAGARRGIRRRRLADRAARGARDRGDAAQLQPRRRHHRLGELDRVGLPGRPHAQRRAGRQGLVELGVDEQAGAEHADVPVRGAAPGGAGLGAVLPRRHDQLGADHAGAAARHRRRLGGGARLGDRAARGLARRRQRADGRGRVRPGDGDRACG